MSWNKKAQLQNRFQIAQHGSLILYAWERDIRFLFESVKYEVMKMRQHEWLSVDTRVKLTKHEKVKKLNTNTKQRHNITYSYVIRTHVSFESLAINIFCVWLMYHPNPGICHN